MKVGYNEVDWDKTDKEEVDLINAAIAASETPIHALDAIYDAGRKLLIALERGPERYEIQTGKMEFIEQNFLDLADRVASLEYKEDPRIHDTNELTQDEIKSRTDWRRS